MTLFENTLKYSCLRKLRGNGKIIYILLSKVSDSNLLNSSIFLELVFYSVSIVILNNLFEGDIKYDGEG